MPKQKTHKGAAKRFKVTGGGKVTRHQSMHSHILTKKTTKRKRNLRSLWIVRINAAARLHGLNYSKLIAGLKAAGSDLDRKVLADIAVHDAEGFGRLAEAAKQALESASQTAAAPAAEA